MSKAIAFYYTEWYTGVRRIKHGQSDEYSGEGIASFL